VTAILLAAGAARRMRGRDKLLEALEDGRPVLRHAAKAALASQAGDLVVVLPPDATARRAALAGTGARIVEAPDWAEGMAASLRAGLAAVAPEADAVVLLLADMPEVGARDIDRLIAAFDPAEGRELCRAVTADGTPGHPVLFGRRFFETLAALRGDRGAREVLREAAEFVTDVPTPGRAAAVDLDTPEDWDAWRAGAERVPDRVR
jgi:molybdenum cofactor cytidylyltransferase